MNINTKLKKVRKYGNEAKNKAHTSYLTGLLWGQFEIYWARKYRQSIELTEIFWEAIEIVTNQENS